ncbi:MAG: DNA-binding protein [Prevotella sp.]|nr:DNA-binding protein [Prevotella sp.]
MKLKYIIPFFAAVIALLTGCESDNEAIYLNGLNVSTSYVSLDKNGGTTQIFVSSADAWSFDAASIPAWLTVSPQSGSAGETTVSFSAEAYAGRTAALKIISGNKTQEINVIQGLSEVSNATCAEVIAGPDAKTYRVTGAVTGIANTTYGNWYLNDGTGEIYIYGTLDKSGRDGQNNSIAAWGIEVGDEVTVEGPKTTYNGTVELVNVTVVKISKSLIKVDSLTVDGAKVANAVLPLEGGEVTAHVSCKGDGINVDNLPEWLSISSVTSNTVTFRAQPNTGGDRSATVTLKTYNAGKEYTSQFNIAQAGAILDVTVAEFLAAEVGDTQYRMQGVITGLYESDKQGKSFYIKDFSGETLVYRTEGFLDAGIEVGDVVEVLGKRGAYKDSPQMVNGTCKMLYDVKKVTIAEFLTMPDDKNTYYMVTGKISSLLGSNGKENDYGNLYITDGTTELYVYGTYSGWGATGDFRKFFIADNGLQVGDEITIIGYKDTYKELVELCQGVCFSFKKAE